MPIHYYATLEPSRVFGPYPDPEVALKYGKALAEEFYDPRSPLPRAVQVFATDEPIADRAVRAGALPAAVLERLEHGGPFRIRELVDGRQVVCQEYDTREQAIEARDAYRRRTLRDASHLDGEAS